jgi:predicted ribosome quality control (RQC) complex YloA/Tae2 family protein
VARCFTSEEDMIVLVGRTATDNDVLTFKLASVRDFWLHVAGQSGSHVIVRNPENLDRLPRETKRLAASLAVLHSGGKKGGKTAVHLCRCADVHKPRGLPPGKVTIKKFTTVYAAPAEGEKSGR